MKRLPLLISLLLMALTTVKAQPDLKEVIRKQSEIAVGLKDAVEGFAQKTGGEDISYHSTRQDCQKAMLVRATDGKMSIDWRTPVMKSVTPGAGIRLFLIAGMSLQGYEMNGSDPGFEVSINGKPFFHFRNRMGDSWKVDGPGGSFMQFETVILDQANDGFGYAAIYLPGNMFEPGKPLNIRITGDPSGSQHWFMVFQCPDALAWFRKKTSIDNWFDIRLTEAGGHPDASLTVPATWAGHTTVITPGNGKPVSVRIPDSTTTSLAVHIPLPSGCTSVSIKGPGGLETGSIPLFESVSRSVVQTDRLLSYQESGEPGGRWTIHFQSAMSSISDDLKIIAGSPLASGQFQIMASSHQDIAWMDSPEACVVDRDKLLITPALKKLQDFPAYAIDMEDILMLREYLGRHPDRKPEVYGLSREGRLNWGASYNQPYEDMYFGEPLIREFYLGKKWFGNQFPGCDAPIYWNVDVPGRTLQMPQILSGCGVKYMIISRQERGLYHWEAPDGSQVLTFSPGHYYDAYVNLKKGFFETVHYLSGLTNFWSRVYPAGTHDPVIPVLSDADMAVPDSYFDYIETWNSLRSPELKLPGLKHTSALNFFEKAAATGVRFPVIRGERPDVWLYIHGPSHYEALKAGRSAGRLLPAAEQLAGFYCLASGNWKGYPRADLDRAWEDAIYPDHGWGGKNGNITDSTFRARFEKADSTARSIIRRSAEEISGLVAFEDKGMPLTVFNTLSWERTDPVECRLDFPDGKFRNIRIKDPDGRTVPFQVCGPEDYYPDGYLRSLTVVFIAHEIPSMGYATYYVSGARKANGTAIPGRTPDAIETPHYRIHFGGGGIKSLFDKDLGQEILLTDGFDGGQLFSLHSFGNGAGEFADVQQPDTAGFECPDMDSGWKVVESGPVRMVIRGSAVMKHNQVNVEWTVYREIKRLDVKVELVDWDGTAYREFRLAFPARLRQPEITYEVPFGVVRVGKDELQGPAGERYTTPCPDIHPRGINNWISASDDRFGITLSSAVAVWDYVDPAGIKTNSTLLQPILLASRQSCHGEGPLYAQKGSHTMEFSLFTHKPGWENGYRWALQANEKLVPVFRNSVGPTGNLPERLSFLSVDDPDALVSCVKKAEEGNSLIVRLYDVTGKDREVGVRTFIQPLAAEKTNMLEEGGLEIPVTDQIFRLTLGHHAIGTYRLSFR